MTALQELPEHEKDLILPTIFLRPWATSKELEKAVERIEKAFGQRSFVLDIDRFYTPTSASRQSVNDFVRMREAANFEEWLAFVEIFPKAIPSLRTAGVPIEGIRRQADIATEIDRGFMIRIDRDAGSNVADIAQVVSEIEHSNYLCAVDSGWSNDLLNHMLWASSVVGAVGNIRAEVPVIVSGSSFPDTFTGVEPTGRRTIKERELFAEVARQNNTVHCLYGDWASVRPPSDESVPMTPVPRIDLATKDSWSFFRYRTNDGGYRKAAEEAIASPDWDDSLHVWGTYLVRATSEGDATEITYPGAATAARVNIHMHIQANFDDPVGYLDTEDDFED